MKSRPILFSGPMVRAILDGRKTMTRRVVKPQPHSYVDELHGKELRKRAPYDITDNETGNIVGWGFQDDDDTYYRCPYRAGWSLWVRETFMVGADEIAYAATDQPLVGCSRWRPSIHMNRVYSRITLAIEAVRVERLQDITADDCISEGIDLSAIPGVGSDSSVIKAFRELWESINGTGSWDANPFVWVVSFSRVQP